MTEPEKRPHVDITQYRKPLMVLTLTVAEGDFDPDRLNEPSLSLSHTGHIDVSRGHEGHAPAACLPPQIASSALELSMHLLGVSVEELAALGVAFPIGDEEGTPE